MTDSELSVKPAGFDEKPVVAQLLQLYLYDFTEFIPELKPGPDGLYPYAYLDLYWAPGPGEERRPFLIRSGDKLAGFALVRTVNDHHVMAEFFVLRPHRRSGLGSAAAKEVFRRLPGQWIVHEHPANRPAQAFWRRIIGEFTGGDFSEVTEPDGAVTQRFTSRQ